MSDRRFEDEQLVLVDEGDRPLGLASKGACHLGGGHTHRAFSAVVVDDGGRVLLARRAAAKPLWPGYWDATVASHPREGEAQTAAAARRLREELGVEAAPRPGWRFTYRVAFEDVGVEDEVCAGLLAEVAGDVGLAPEPGEIDALEWVDRATLTRRLAAGDPGLCPWLPPTLLALEPLGFLAGVDGAALTGAAHAWLAGVPFERPWRMLPGAAG